MSNRPEYRYAEAITKHDTNPNVFDAVQIGGAGIIKVDTVGGDSAVQITCQAGDLLELGVTRVYSTDTSATLMVGLRR